MKLTLLFSINNTLLHNYKLILGNLILYNDIYDGKFKNIINKNLNTIKYLNILIEEIGIIIFYKKSVDDFIDFFNTLKLDDYTLKDIDNDVFLYHIKKNDYKVCVELFEFLKYILKTIKIYCDELKIIKNEISNKIKELQIKEIKKESSSSLDIYRKTLELYIINKKSKSNKKDIINDIIKNIISLKHKKKLTELKKIFNDNNIYIFDEYIEDNDDNRIDDIIKILKKENKDNLNIISELIISQYLKISSDKSNEDLINEIIFKLINIHLDDLLEDIKGIISLNYEKKISNKTNEEYIIEIIKNVLLEQNLLKKISYVKRILNENYTKRTNSSSKTDETIKTIVNKITEIKDNKKNIIKNIKEELNIKGIFILDNYLKEDDYYLLMNYINEIRDKLRILDNMKLKKIINIISKYKTENHITKDLNNLEKYYKFLYSWDNLYLNKKDKIVYIINQTNDIKREIEKSDLLSKDIKDIILNRIVYYSYDISDNIEIDIGNFLLPINKIKNEIYNIHFLHIKDLMNIIKLYHKIISNNLKDNKIIENINEILNIDNHNSYEYLLKEFKYINKYYKFDYNFFLFNNYSSFRNYLEKIYLYKNYIYIIKNLYNFLLTIKDNFNLLYTTIERIKKYIQSYKKIDSSLKEILFNKLNDVNQKMDNEIIFNNYQDIEQYLNNLIEKYSK